MSLEIVLVGGKIKFNMWNIIVITFCSLAIIFNSYLWIKYRRKANKEVQIKQGWNSFHFITTLLLITVLLTRIGKL